MDEQSLQAFVERLRAAHGDHLVSVVLYGSEACDDATLRSTCHILVVLDRIRLSDLRAEHEAVADWVAAGYAPPVYFSEEEIADAGDVFPIEFLELAENRRVLAGRDVLAGLDVSTRHLRHQVEFELRGKLIRLRRLYVPASSDPGRLSSLLVQSLGTFIKLFKFALQVTGGSAPAGEREVLRAAVAHFGLDAAPFDKILGALDRGEPMREADAHACFGTYIEQIERVIEAVDKLPDA